MWLPVRALVPAGAEPFWRRGRTRVVASAPPPRNSVATTQHGNTTSNKVPYPEHDTHASTWPPRPSSIVVGAAAAAAPGAEASSVNWIASAAGRVLK